MISVLTHKLVQTSGIVLENKKCLRNRLRGYSCQRCVAGCSQKAIEDCKSQIIFNSERCTGCGVCVAACPGDSFSSEGFDLCKTLQQKTGGKDLVVSCYGGGYKSENELRLPCVGVLPPEALVILGLKKGGDVVINLSECSGCTNRLTADSFVRMFQFVHRRAGHLFRNRFGLAHIAADLPPQKAHDRRQFLFSLGENVTDIIQGHFAPQKRKKQRPVGTRPIPIRTQLITKILQQESATPQELVEICAPDVQISSSCTRCPRCTGMCPTGALKIRKNGSEKVLSYDRTLCTACGLCVEFCKEGAISIRAADLVSRTPIFGRSPISVR